MPTIDGHRADNQRGHPTETGGRDRAAFRPIDTPTVEAVQWNGPEDSPALKAFFDAHRLPDDELRFFAGTTVGAHTFPADTWPIFIPARYNGDLMQSVFPGDWLVCQMDGILDLWGDAEFRAAFVPVN